MTLAMADILALGPDLTLEVLGTELAEHQAAIPALVEALPLAEVAATEAETHAADLRSAAADLGERAMSVPVGQRDAFAAQERQRVTEAEEAATAALVERNRIERELVEHRQMVEALSHLTVGGEVVKAR